MSLKVNGVSDELPARHVPELKVVNGLAIDVVLLDGEELIGAKQNRIVNTTIVVGKGQAIVIPVSCVERGRWHHRSKHFGASKGHLYADLRKKKMKAVYENLRQSRSYQANQSEIWKEIQMKAERLSVNSDTEAMSDIYTSYEKDLGEYEKAFKVKPGQTGFIVLIDGKVVGMDLFGFTSVPPRVYAKLLRGYILDALDRAEKPWAVHPSSFDVDRSTRKFIRSFAVFCDSSGGFLVD